MPNSTTNYSYVIYPLQAGYCKLPKLKIKLNNMEISDKKAASDINENFDLNNLESVVQSMLPTQLFIMPKTTNIASSS